jgi:hypothetical protein
MDVLDASSRTVVARAALTRVMAGDDHPGYCKDAKVVIGSINYKNNSLLSNC